MRKIGSKKFECAYKLALTANAILTLNKNLLDKKFNVAVGIVFNGDLMLKFYKFWNKEGIGFDRALAVAFSLQIPVISI